MNIRNSIFIFLLLGLNFSCKLREETIIPFAEPQTISEIQQAIFQATSGRDFDASSTHYYTVEGDNEHFYLKLRYQMDKISNEDLDDAQDDLARASKSILSIFSRVFFKFGGKHKVDIPPMTFTIPTMEYDRDIIVDVTVSKVHLEFLNKLPTNSFEFIRKLDISTPNPQTQVNEIIMGYNNKSDTCGYNCMDFTLYKTSLTEVIASQDTMTVSTTMKISKLPSKKIELKFKGYVELFVKLKLPF